MQDYVGLVIIESAIANNATTVFPSPVGNTTIEFLDLTISEILFWYSLFSIVFSLTYFFSIYLESNSIHMKRIVKNLEL